MFTGIVQSCVQVVALEQKTKLTRFALSFPKNLLRGLRRGASVAIDGVCLTATDMRGGRVWFDAMDETMRKTTLGSLRLGARVNVERSARVSDELGGHLVFGHVTGTAKIIKVISPKNNRVVTFQIPRECMKYIFLKGFIALDGCSLTVVDVSHARATFTVALIPETLRLTTFGFKGVGDRVNFELDSRTQIIVDTVEGILAKRKR